MEKQMAEFCFYKKHNQVAVVSKSETSKAASLVGKGWKKMFEEVRAADAESALARLAEIRKEEIATERFVISGTAFSEFLIAFLK